MKTNTINIAQMQVIPGQPEKNLKNIIKEIKNSDSEMIIFPEMAVPGYFIGDDWENESFIKECHDMNQEIIDTTKNRARAIWGNILIDETKQNEDGSFRKYNAGFIAQNGQKISNGIFDGYTIKSLMPKYKQFDDERYFYSLDKLAREEGKSLDNYFKPFEIIIDGIKRNVGIVVCEDMWDRDYQTKPVDLLKQSGSDIIVNISASPFSFNKQVKREKIMREKSEGIDFIYANNTGVQNTGKNIFVFDGESSVFQNGEKIGGGYFLEEAIISAYPKLDSQNRPHPNPLLRGEGTEGNLIHPSPLRRGAGGEVCSKENYLQFQTHQVLVYGIKEFMTSIKQKKAVIGLSGGIDSAIVATLLVDAIGRENVTAINMPSKFNSSITKNIAANLAEKLGIKYIEVPIQDSVDITKNEIEIATKKEVKGLVLENIQARDRGARVLAGIASQENAIFTANGNKTEIALGYATLYGDVSGAFAPIGDLYKTQVYELARYLDIVKGGILSDVINVMPSAELSEHQDVEMGKGDPFNYPFVDAILYQIIEERKDLDYILDSFLEGTLEEKLKMDKKIVPEIFPTNLDFAENVEKIYKMMKNNFFKRVQSSPIISVSKRAFGTDLRESQNGIYFTRNYRDLKDKIIKKDKLDEIYDKFLRAPFANKVKDKYHHIYEKDAGVWEKYSIATHTAMVLNNFEKFFAQDKFPKIFDREIFKLILALHDIGKPEAIENEGKEAQHGYTAKMIEEFFDEMEIDEKYKKFAISLIGIDVVGEYLQDKISLDEAREEIEKRTVNSGFDTKTFVELLIIFFRVDAGAYTTGAGGFEALDKLFVFDFDNMILDLAVDVKEKVEEIMR